MCRHCRMDDVWVGWEARLFRLESRAMGAGGYVSHEDALRQVSLKASWTLDLAHDPVSCILLSNLGCPPVWPGIARCERRCLCVP